MNPDEIHIADLPRRDPFISLYSQVAKSVAGCVICDRPIAKGVARLSILVHLPEPRTSPSGVTRKSERFNVHAGCLVASLSGDDLVTGWNCWDCGADPQFKQGHPWKCYTTSRFAPGALCERCAQRSRWRACELCMVFFPQWMVSEVVSGPDEGDEACEFCAARSGSRTVFQVKREAEEFEALRARMATGEVFPK